MAKKSKEADGAAKKGSSKKIIVVVVIAVAWFKFMGPGKAKPSAAKTGAGVHAVKEGEVMALPDLTLNLADTGEPRYLRVGLAMILESGTSAESMKNDAAIASDVAVDVLSARTFEDLRQPGAKDVVKKELSERVRKAYEGKKVARVIFTSFVMQ
jgi:flagellar FliL protein